VGGQGRRWSGPSGVRNGTAPRRVLIYRQHHWLAGEMLAIDVVDPGRNDRLHSGGYQLYTPHCADVGTGVQRDNSRIQLDVPSLLCTPVADAWVQ